jgi:hypothetical protein
MDCLSRNIEGQIPLHAIAQQKGIYLRTLQRWKHSFSENQVAKHSCLLPGQHLGAKGDFASTLLARFRIAQGKDHLVAGAIDAMIRLWSSLNFALY